MFRSETLSLDKRFRVKEIPVAYRNRPNGSYSKLNTFRDGLRVLNTIAKIMRYYKPLLFFTIFSLIFALTGLLCGLPVLIEYFSTNYITHTPLAIPAAGLEIFALLLFVAGLILDSNSYYTKLNYECMRHFASNKSIWWR